MVGALEGGGYKNKHIRPRLLSFQFIITNLTTMCHLNTVSEAISVYPHSLFVFVATGRSGGWYEQLPLDLIPNSMRKGVVQRGEQERAVTLRTSGLNFLPISPTPTRLPRPPAFCSLINYCWQFGRPPVISSSEADVV